MASQLSLPGGAIGTATPSVGSGQDYVQIQSERLLAYGSTVGKQVYKVGVLRNQAIAGGAPGTNNLDLYTQVPLGAGSANMAGVAGKLVYLEVVQVTGAADMAVRKSGGTAIELLAGTTDALYIRSRAVLVDVLESTATRTTAGITFDATHKNLQFECTAAATFDVLYAVI